MGSIQNFSSDERKSFEIGLSLLVTDKSMRKAVEDEQGRLLEIISSLVLRAFEKKCIIDRIIVAPSSVSIESERDASLRANEYVFIAKTYPDTSNAALAAYAYTKYDELVAKQNKVSIIRFIKNKIKGIKVPEFGVEEMIYDE